MSSPLAGALRSISEGLSVVAPDRRGCGLNDGHGDLGSVEAVIGDVVSHVKALKEDFERVHLAGWCQGSQYASVAASRAGDLLSSLILLTPGFFWNERFRSVIRITESNIFSMVAELRLKPDHNQAWVPIPMEPADFTLDEKWLDFIENDNLKTTKITMKTAHIMDEIQELSWSAILQTRLPVLTVLADRDRIVDNNKVRQFMGPMFSGDNRNKLACFDCGHAIQFERPVDVAGEIIDFIKQL